jgi:hypothetical protein
MKEEQQFLNEMEEKFRARTCMEMATYLMEEMKKNNMTTAEIEFTITLMKRQLDLVITDTLIKNS